VRIWNGRNYFDDDVGQAFELLYSHHFDVFGAQDYQRIFVGVQLLIQRK
jgi:hypothetical protein